MNQKTLIGLAVAALVAIVVAVVVNHSRQPQSESGGVDTETSYLVPGLRDHVNDVDKLVLTGAENKPIATLTRGADGWTLAEKGNYAADTGKLRELLLKLADAKILEEKTSNKDKYETLGVEDLAGKDAKGVQIELGGLGQPVKLIVGNANTRGGTFVRRAGEARSWLVSASLNVDKKAENWLRKDVVDVQANRIASVTVTHPDGKTVRVAKEDEGDANFKLADIPKGREVSSEYAVNGLSSTLANLRFDDVLPAKDAAPGDKPLKARYATFDGLVVDVVAWEKDGKHYAQLSASVDSEQAGKHIEAQQAKAKADYESKLAEHKNASAADAEKPAEGSAPAETKADSAEPPKPPEVADPAKDREEKLAAIEKEAADLNARVKDWTYVIPAYKYANIDKSMDDLLKPVEKKERSGKKSKSAKSDD
jgi:hypothetical protein